MQNARLKDNNTTLQPVYNTVSDITQGIEMDKETVVTKQKYTSSLDKCSFNAVLGFIF